MGLGKAWTVEEIEYLQDKWGIVSIPGIAKALNKTVVAIKCKALKEGLHSHLQSGEEVTLNQLIKAIAVNNGHGWTIEKWIKHGLPVKFKKPLNMSYKVILIDDFWKWAEKNKNIINFKKFEKGLLGAEPKWVAEKRRADIKASKFKRTPWTKEEDQHLKSLLNSYKYNYKELSKTLKRTDGSIQKRMNNLCLMQRPLRADNHTKWTEKEVELLISMRELGYSAPVIADSFPLRSIKAVQGKLERMAM